MEQDFYTPLFIVLSIAWLVPMVLTWLKFNKVPSVIMEIILGVIIGPSVLGLVYDNVILSFLSEAGFLFLIFLSGLEVDINKILSSFPRGRMTIGKFLSNSLLLAVLIYIGSLIISYLLSVLISLFFTIDVWFLTLLLPTVALSIVVPILKADEQIGRRYGQVMLMEGAISTIMSIILISIYSGILQQGFQTELLLFVVIFVVFFISYKLGQVLLKVNIFKKLMYVLEHAASQIRIRGSIAVLLGFVVVASLIKTELILGAFFAGSLLSMFLSRERSALHFKLDGMGYGFFIPIFFIMVGVNLDISVLQNLGQSLVFVSLITGAFFLVQLLPASFMLRLYGWRRSVGSAFLLSSRLGLTIAAAQIGMNLEVLSPALNTGIVIAAIITTILAPTLFKLFVHDTQQGYSVYIIGGRGAALHLAERLRLHSIPCLVIERDDKTLDELSGMGHHVKRGYHINLAMYQSLGIKPYDPIVVMTSSPERNEKIIRKLREIGHNKLITMSGVDALLELSGVTLIDMDETIATHIENLLMRPAAYMALNENFGTYSVEEIRITNRRLDRKKVRDIAFSPSGSIVVVRRNKEVFIPHGDTAMLYGDMITVIGDTKALVDFRDKFQRG